MHLSLGHFRLLRPRAQLLHVFLEGTYLAKRWQRTGFIRLYHLPDAGRGFLAEVGLDETQECFVVLRSFSDSKLLADYAREVRLLAE